MTKEEMQELRAMMKDVVGEELAPMKKDISEIKTDVASLKVGLTKIEVKIENEIDRSIKIVAEGHGVINRKLDEKIALENRVEKVENRVSAVEYVLKKAE